jgi:multicomponent Na+:H+ antiporter subunit C
MELLVAILIGFLFSVGTYLILERRLLRVVMGTALISHGVLLFLITAGSLKRGLSPIIGEGTESSGPFVDPVPQALILTAIVISFATTAFALALAFKMYRELGTDDLERLRGTEVTTSSQNACERKDGEDDNAL